MILIKGMAMPRSCYDCPLAMQDYTTLFGKNINRTRNSYSCVLTHKAITSTRRNRFCPLVSIPPHGGLIEKGTLLDKCYQHYEDFMWGKVDGKTALLNIEKEIKAAPIIPAEEDK